MIPISPRFPHIYAFVMGCVLFLLLMTEIVN